MKRSCSTPLAASPSPSVSLKRRFPGLADGWAASTERAARWRSTPPSTPWPTSCAPPPPATSAGPSRPATPAARWSTGPELQIGGLLGTLAPTRSWDPLDHAGHGLHPGPGAAPGPRRPDHVHPARPRLQHHPVGVDGGRHRHRGGAVAHHRRRWAHRRDPRRPAGHRPGPVGGFEGVEPDRLRPARGRDRDRRPRRRRPGPPRRRRGSPPPPGDSVWTRWCRPPTSGSGPTPALVLGDELLDVVEPYRVRPADYGEVRVRDRRPVLRGLRRHGERRPSSCSRPQRNRRQWAASSSAWRPASPPSTG